jgi:hypothetical protein
MDGHLVETHIDPLDQGEKDDPQAAAATLRAFAELEANSTSAALSHAEWLALLLDREATERYDRRLRARLRYARLRH